MSATQRSTSAPSSSSRFSNGRFWLSLRWSKAIAFRRAATRASGRARIPTLFPPPTRPLYPYATRLGRAPTRCAYPYPSADLASEVGECQREDLHVERGKDQPVKLSGGWTHEAVEVEACYPAFVDTPSPSAPAHQTDRSSPRSTSRPPCESSTSRRRPAAPSVPVPTPFAALG